MELIFDGVRGSISSYPQALKVVNGALYFLAREQNQRTRRFNSALFRFTPERNQVERMTDAIASPVGNAQFAIHRCEIFANELALGGWAVSHNGREKLQRTPSGQTIAAPYDFTVLADNIFFTAKSESSFADDSRRYLHVVRNNFQELRAVLPLSVDFEPRNVPKPRQFVSSLTSFDNALYYAGASGVTRLYCSAFRGPSGRFRGDSENSQCSSYARSTPPPTPFAFSPGFFPNNPVFTLFSPRPPPVTQRRDGEGFVPPSTARTRSQPFEEDVPAKSSSNLPLIFGMIVLVAAFAACVAMACSKSSSQNQNANNVPMDNVRARDLLKQQNRERKISAENSSDMSDSSRDLELAEPEYLAQL